MNEIPSAPNSIKESLENARILAEAILATQNARTTESILNATGADRTVLITPSEAGISGNNPITL